ncbi:ABC transporter substrate-binding protein [Anaerosphaera multitolerans]|uniref:Spermidine/putrescine ABC transporter substrate-binding protein n=1 Tax=Anaerosphaera multitolerans TaxID=2487351 RepID=A0A437S8I7_9FIRM|nr:spermidine/putrescine ABC transporter substrate-binding protein [Anaerosphaera multitolerans]RVU55251.1 spermidine/putrescine ABC transporter substrate-binding protein [Anaerosphaera multitolerans]
MKKNYLLITVVLILSLTLLVGCSSNSNKEELHIYNWGEYIDDSLIDEFEKETGIKVVYDTFEQNEDMYMKLKEGGSNYDLVVPSDYMIERMISENMLSKINYDNIPNMKNIGKEFLYRDYDPNQEYSVPYLWGTVGILYNKSLVDDSVESWNILWNEKYENEIIMMNSTRDSIGIALLKNDFSMNSRNLDELEIAKKDLIKQKPLVKAYLVDEMKGQMVNEEAALAPAYTGDAIVAMAENENLDFVIPKEGANLWFDAMVIPENAQNKENAEKFINFILEPENSAKIADYVGYPLVNTEAVKLLPEEIRNSEVIYPNLEEYPNLEIFKDPKDFNKVYDEIWSEVKL